MRLHLPRCIAVVIFCGFLAGGDTRVLRAVDLQNRQDALSPQESLKRIVVDKGLKVELVANEPNIQSPVAVRFDEDGRMWVVQMRDYPTGPTKQRPERSRLSILTDKDGDGFFETAQVFADDLPFATGVQPWKGGAFVTMSGKMLYMKDTNGDGKADAVETWYTGFSEENQQLRANHPTFALDNHIYISNGLRGGTIVDPKRKKSKPVRLMGLDFRFDPLTRKFDGVTGIGQWGLTFDDFGNRFECTNRNPVIHMVLEDRLLKQNRLAAVGAVANDVAKAAGDSRLYSTGRVWVTSNLHEGTFTAACGVTVYRGDILPAAYYGNVFTCDPTARVVHREIMKPDGVTFVSNRLPEKREFFASSDEWSCPVNLETGPDGAMYVVDMYRQIIEHPEWMPPELQKRPNLRAGADRGRIYRIVRQDSARQNLPQFSKLDSDALVAELSHANSWRRETAQRLLVERQDKRVVPHIEQTAKESDSPLARIHALRVLQGLSSLSEKLVLRLLNDPNPRIVEQAILAAETSLDDWKQAREKIQLLAQQKDARVRFFALLVGMPFPSAPKYTADHWEQDAILIAARKRSGVVVAEMLKHPAELKANIKEPKQFIAELARQAAASKDANEYLPALRALLGNADYERAGLTGFLADMARNGVSLDYVRAKLGEKMNGQLNRAFETARRDAENTGLRKTARNEAIDLLAFAPNAAETLTRLALDDANQNVRLRAIGALTKSHSFQSWTRLLSRIAAQTPVEQRAVLDGVFVSVERTLMLMDEIEAGRTKATIIDPIHAKLLLENRDLAIKNRAEKVIASAVPADREKVLAQYKPVLKMKAETSRGRAIFEKRCSICHKIGNIGVSFAPDISDSREKTPEQLLTDILQPNRAIDNNYFSYTVITNDGRSHNGVLAAETSTSVTLKKQEGKTETLRRDEISEMHNDGVSFMPEGLEKDIPMQDMADLISFVKNWRYLETAQQQQTAGAKPQAEKDRSKN
jgi:putative membrane-bound dehydrogenase-like protein